MVVQERCGAERRSPKAQPSTRPGIEPGTFWLVVRDLTNCQPRTHGKRRNFTSVSCCQCYKNILVNRLSFSYLSVLRIFVRSEGCDDPGIPQDSCGKAVIKVNGRDYSKHGRGHNVVVVNYDTGRATVLCCGQQTCTTQSLDGRIDSWNLKLFSVSNSVSLNKNATYNFNYDVASMSTRKYSAGGFIQFL